MASLVFNFYDVLEVNCNVLGTSDIALNTSSWL